MEKQTDTALNITDGSDHDTGQNSSQLEITQEIFPEPQNTAPEPQYTTPSPRRRNVRNIVLTAVIPVAVIAVIALILTLINTRHYSAENVGFTIEGSKLTVYSDFFF